MNTQLDNALISALGVDAAGIEQVTSVSGPLPQAYFSVLLRAIDNSGVVELIKSWDAEERKSPGGRIAQVSQRAVLMAFLLNAQWGVGFSYQELAHTIAHRLTPQQRAELGVTGAGRVADDWYHSARRTAKRVVKLIDPWHLSNLHGRKTGAEYEQALADYDPEREERSHQFAAALVRASTELLPKKYLDAYTGDLALDSTFLRVRGISNPAKKDTHGHQRDRFNTDYQCGWYTRSSENHDGTKTAKSLPGYELDTTVMVAAHDGSYEFPLITGISMHRPSELKQGPKLAMDQHAAFTEKRGIAIMDRAFNNLDPQHFQEYVRRHRFETAYDYRGNQLGRQGSIPGEPVILVDGVLYVDRMPENYVMISRWHAQQKVNPDTGLPYTTAERDEILALREPYRMKAHGRIDADGNQRFTYPTKPYLAFDPVTGRPTKDHPTGTVTAGLAKETIKHLQKYPWMSKEWRQVYGQRNQVETSNKNIKGQRWANLGDPAARTGRGYAYTYLCAVMAVFAENIRRIITGISNTHSEKSTTPKERARRRRDSLGDRLPRRTGYAAARRKQELVPELATE